MKRGLAAILALTLLSTVFRTTSLSPFYSRPVFADDIDSGTSEDSPLKVRNTVGDILLSGLVGGILGLSTLSFYSQPGDNVRNIFWGAGLGMIVTTLYMTFSVATTPLQSDKAFFEYKANLVVPYASVDPTGNSAGVLWMHHF